MALITCNECGHQMSDKATFCPNCGAANHTAQQLYQQSEPYYAPTEQPANNSSKTILMVIIGLLICAIIAVVILLVLSGSKKTTAASTETPEKLPVASVSSIYELRSSKGVSYSPLNLTDGILSSAWSVDLNDFLRSNMSYFEGPVFTLNASNLHHVVLSNGYQKSYERYLQNTRARRLTIYRRNNNTTNLNPDVADIIYRGDVADTQSPITLPVASTFDNSRPTTSVGLLFSTSMADYYRGTRWNDLTISEIEFWGNNGTN